MTALLSFYLRNMSFGSKHISDHGKTYASPVANHNMPDQDKLERDELIALFHDKLRDDHRILQRMA
ncbi:hypothetical protein [Roseovarius sp. 2305UL8-3]|uniref:hypothetical protein n=1 Tax=Roseovarius conchicola TaxID=3121636 RepID=UPI0035296CD6